MPPQRKVSQTFKRATRAKGAASADQLEFGDSLKGG
jgi:hypothetical protein